MSDILEKMYHQHDVICNQKYGDNLPYSFHLKAVVAQVERYKNCFYNPILTTFEQNWLFEQARRGAAGHDLIEDARLTFNDIKAVYGIDIANIIYACTETKGHDRKERHSQEFFNTLKENRIAVFVKLCDVMANVLYSMLMHSSMYVKYQSEFHNLYAQLYVEGEYERLWEDLEALLR